MYLAVAYLRFEIHDEDGCLRKFATKDEALRFKSEDMLLVIKPRPRSKNRKQIHQDFIDKLGEAIL